MDQSPAQAFELALKHFLAGQPQQAAAICTRILAAHPNHPDALHLLGAVALGEGRFGPAVTYFQSAIAGYTSTDDLAEAYSNLGIAFMGLQNLKDSIAAHRKSLALRPDSAESNNNLGFALKMAGNEAEAEAAVRRALAIRPLYPSALNNLGNILHARGEYAQAVEALERGLAADPQSASIHWDLSLLLLLLGNGTRGWREYEWRLRLPAIQRQASRFMRPRWDGNPLDGRRILLHCEQGLGDSVHFSRYVAEVAARGGKVTVACPSALYSLFETLAGVDRLIRSDSPFGDFDVHCPLPSLPSRLNLPEPRWTGVYLSAYPARAAKFSDFLKKSGNRFKVGLVWHGRPYPTGRSIPLAEFKSLAMDDVQLFSLQVGDGNEQINQVDFDIINAAEPIENLADTAALMRQMDLIISIDTVTAQLAGALGLRAWVMLKKVPDWRWLLDRPDSPWYPTLRLFRQTRAGQWEQPIREAARELQALVHAG
jgi:Flp pilus assembly protein TadD